MKNLEALLIFPPPMDRIDRSYPAPHYLTNFLNKHGLNSKPLDLNRIAFRQMVNSSLLYKEYLFYHARKRELEKKSSLSEDELSRYLAHMRSIARLGFAIEKIKGLKKKQSLMHLEINGIPYSKILIDLYIKIFGPFYHTPLLSLDAIKRFISSSKGEHIKNLLSAPLRREIFRKGLLLVGFSIPFYQQFVPSIILATEIKKSAKNVHICFGGPVITLLSNDYLKGVLRSSPIDSFIKYAGEIPLLKLVRSIKAGKPFNDIGNLISTGADISTHHVPSREPRIPFDHHRYDFSNICDLPRTSAIAITQSTGCYWGKCSFCDYINLHKDKKYRFRPAEEIVNDIIYYQKMGFSNFRMLAEAIPPKHAFEIAHRILRKKLNITWHAFFRIDPRFNVHILKTMKESGFTGTIGMESASNRTLQLLNKGYKRKHIRTLFKNMQQAGLVENHLNIMVGVPGTGYEDELKTFDFCKRYMDIFSWFKTSEFCLTETSEMGKNPEKYGISLRGYEDDRRPHGGGRLRPLSFTDKAGMNQAEKAYIIKLYDGLNKEVKLDRKYNGLYDQLRSAETGKELKNVKFIFNRDELVDLKLKFLLNGTRVSGNNNGGKRMIINLNKKHDSQFVCNAEYAKWLKHLRGNTLDFSQICEKIGNVDSSLRFIKRMASEALLVGMERVINH